MVRLPKGVRAMAHKLMWAVLLIGLMLIAAPFAIGLPDKSDGS